MPTGATVNAYVKYLKFFQKIKRECGAAIMKEHGLDCQVGMVLESAALKIQGRGWGDRAFKEGVFFSIWIGDREARLGRVAYNIHALKLGRQRCFKVKPVQFARAFRARFDPRGWPNVSLDHGPQTLMEGWLPLMVENLESDGVLLVERFVRMHGMVDELLRNSGF